MEFNSFDFGDDLFTLPSLPPSSISPPLETNNVLSQKKRNGRRKKAVPNTQNNENGEEMPDERKKRKLIHRDVERQRRQEMSSLYTTLRSLLPFECLKVWFHGWVRFSFFFFFNRKIIKIYSKLYWFSPKFSNSMYHNLYTLIYPLLWTRKKDEKKKKKKIRILH